MWNPEESSLGHLLDLLNQAQLPDNTIQKKVSEEINNLSQNPEIYNYLAYIFCLENNDAAISLKTKNVAGVVLKGMIERNYDKIAPENLDYVKTKLIQVFNDSNPTIQNVSTVLFAKLGSQKWPEFSQLLKTNLDSDNTELINLSLKYITRILEDAESTVASGGEFDQNMLAESIPKLFEFCTSAWPVSIQESALKSLKSITTMNTLFLVINRQNYLNILFENANSQNINIRKLSCEGLKEILITRRDIINEALERVFESLLKLTMDPDNQVRKVAVGFWDDFFMGNEDEFNDRPEIIQNNLTILMPALLDCLQYSEEDMLEDTNAKENHSIDIEDDEEEEKEPLMEDNESADEDDEDGDEGETFQYTLRKQAARLMEILSRQFEQEAFSKVQSKLEQYLGNENNWIIRESGILCLGALARGAYEAITTHFEHIFPFLMQSLESPGDVLRSTTCWTLSRFKSWIVNQSRNEPEIMKAYLPAILKLMTDDDNFKVQQASCSALASLCSEGPEFIEESINDVIQAIVIALNKYENKKILGSVYDAISMIVTNLSPEVIQSEAVESALMEALLQKWTKECSFDSNHDAVLIESVDSMVTALDRNAKKYAETFIKGALDAIDSYIEKRNEGDQKKKQLYQKREIAIRCIDLLNTFVEVLKNEALQFINPETFFNIFQECANDQDTFIRQTLLGLVSQIVKTCPAFFNNYIEKIAETLDQNLMLEPNDPSNSACYNNAVFAVGEFSMACGQSFHKYIPDFAKKMSQTLSGTLKLHKQLSRTLAYTIGRLGLVSPDEVLPSLQTCFKQFCLSMSPFQPHDVEYKQAFKGFIQMISRNPQIVQENILFLFQLFAYIDQDLTELHQLASQFITIISAGADFASIYTKLPPHLKQSLTQNFGITF